MKTIWAFIERDERGAFLRECRKLLEQAEELSALCGGRVVTVEDSCGGTGSRGSLDETGEADEVLCENLALRARDEKPWAIVAAATPRVNNLAARLAVKLETGVSPNCLGMQYHGEDDSIHWLRPVYDNTLLAETTCRVRRPQIGTLRIASPDASREWSEDFAIEDAEVVVCVGRGCGCGEGLALAKELAAALGAALGATRTVTDAGWLPVSKQIGQTGKYIRPRVYIGVGVAGAIQHLAGMRDSDIIIAINKDERASIFEYADYGVVGDLYKVLPVMIAEIKRQSL